MPSSPTIENITSNFNKMKKKLGMDSEDVSTLIKHYYIILLLYPFIILSLLLWFRPRIILENDKEEKCICYKKLIMWFILLQVPLFLYYLLNQKKLR
jgi:hypothetical protein